MKIFLMVLFYAIDLVIMCHKKKTVITLQQNIYIFGVDYEELQTERNH